MTQKQVEELLTVQQVMAILQVSDESVYRFIQRGKLEAIKVGSLWRVRKVALDAFLSNRRVTNAVD